MTTNSEQFEGWAILELLGRRRLIGYLSAVTFAGAPFVRIEVLSADGGQSTQYYSPQAVYAITPTTEETARRAASLNTVAPINRWELPAPKIPDAVAAAATGYVGEDNDDDLWEDGDDSDDDE